MLYCGADEIAIVGQRAASLTSVVLSQLFGRNTTTTRSSLRFPTPSKTRRIAPGSLSGAVPVHASAWRSSSTSNRSTRRLTLTVADGFKDHWPSALSGR